MWVGLLSLVGCGADQPDVALGYRSTLRVPALGLALYDDGGAGRAGMYATSCPFDTTSGNVTGDYDVDSDQETVTDAGESTLGGESALLIEPNGIHLIDSTGDSDTHESTPLVGALDARLSDFGPVVWLNQGSGCSVRWTSADAEVDVPCGEAFDSTVDGTALILGDALVVVTSEGKADTFSTAHGDLLAWDGTSLVAYVAQSGGDEVSAVELSGAIRWTTAVEGAVVALTDGGELGVALVSVAMDDGSGAMLFLDGLTGVIVDRVATPVPATGLAMSRDGTTAALVLPEETHFYGVNLAR